jgi:hypothetical protein
VRAVWYDEQGPATEVLQVSELPDPEPGAGEVRAKAAVHRQRRRSGTGEADETAQRRQPISRTSTLGRY